jgi:hypothetical protein
MLTGKRTREFNPGPASRSRKKRSQVGAKGLPRKRAVRVPFFETETRSKKYEAKKLARKAIGARGVKTNARRTRKSTRVPFDKMQGMLRAAMIEMAEKRQAELAATDTTRAS